MRSFVLIALLAVAMGAGCSSGLYVAGDRADWRAQRPPEGELHRVYLVGDAGGLDPAEPSFPVADAIIRSLGGAPASRTIVFLGDNIYCCGLPDSAASGRPRAQARLDRQISLATSFGGRAVFMPGNHDWNDSGPEGPEYVRRMERYVEAELGEGSFSPSAALPGPEIFELEDDVVLIAIDTEWWLTRRDRPYGDTGEYEIDEELDFVVALQDALHRHAGDRVLLVGHHPVHSQGPHNGRFEPKVHLFPLTLLNSSAYIPLPVLGSLYVLGSRAFGSRQDLPNPRYRALRAVLETASSRSESLVYAAGHEHSMQLFQRGPSHKPVYHVVSGSSSAPQYVAGGGDAFFTSGDLGYSTISYYRDGSVWISFWNGASGTPELLFRQRLQEGTVRTVADEYQGSTPDYRDSTVTTAINTAYAASGLRKAVLGSHNRDLWTIPVEAPVLDLGRKHGGLTPEKRGGGMQTVSLRLSGGDGQDYVLRSLDKDPSATVPENLQGTLATDVVQDQISSINPYAAFALPPLARAVGVYHTEPELVFVPDDPRLGPYRETFANQLMMLEHRPDDDVSGYDNYGNSRKVVSAEKLYEELREDNDNRVDVVAFVRARLFDMLLSDWDRHRGQWRWARFDDPDGKGDIYRPIPRDRDWAMNRMTGFVSVVAPFFDPKFQSFNPDFGSIKGLTTNGLEQDRRFLAGLDLATWIREAEHIRDAITPAVIAEALDRLPPPIREAAGDRIRNNLASRAARLPEAATAYYTLLARVVDVVGSDKHERFEVEHRQGLVTVRVFKTSREGEKDVQLFERVFTPRETKEIRLFGLGGRDHFEIAGEARRSIRIRAIGGPGQDSADDESLVASPGKPFTFIDTDRGTDVSANNRTRVRITDDPVLNTYSSTDYQHDVLLPQIYVASNKDDGLFLGGGVLVTHHGFRKQPFRTQQRFVANVATLSRAFNVQYAGVWTGALSNWDVRLDADILTPNNLRNFYGLGNETRNTVSDRTFYQARLSRVEVVPTLQSSVGEIITVRTGPQLQFTKVREEPDRFLAQQPGIASNTFEDQWLAGGVMAIDIEAMDNTVNPRSGVRWHNAATLRYGLSNLSATFFRLESDVRVYVPVGRSPQVTLALRTGGEHIAGDFPFYESATLGGSKNLRGYRNTRFAGRSAVYQNSELRIKVFNVSSYVASGALGVYGFFDTGRVWTDGESSDVWHTGYGGGLWLNAFGSITATADYGLSEDDRTFALRLGFQY